MSRFIKFVKIEVDLVNKYSYAEEVSYFIESQERFHLRDSQVAFDILFKAKFYDDDEVVPVLNSLPEKFKCEVEKIIASYKATGTYFVVCGSGYSEDVSGLMARLSKLV